jgi:hypothetical protein
LDCDISTDFCVKSMIGDQLRAVSMHFAANLADMPCSSNEFAPEVIAILWRPSTFQPKIFTAINSESVRPVEHKDWKSDSMVVDNVKDFMRELSRATRDIVIDIKVFDDRSKKRETESSREPQKTTPFRRSYRLRERRKRWIECLMAKCRNMYLSLTPISG